MDEMSDFLSPSQIYERIRELRQKQDWEDLSADEKLELRQLKNLLRETSSESDFE